MDGTRCAECVDRSFAFAGAVCAGRLEPPLSRVIALYKDAAERRYADLLGQLLIDACSDWRGWPDAVCAIPPTRMARARRGFDHTEALARSLARGLEAPWRSLLTVARTDDQRHLGREARFANMAGAFAVPDRLVVPARVLVVDDVFTTGATLDAAARALCAAGAFEVRVAAVARAQAQRLPSPPSQIAEENGAGDHSGKRRPGTAASCVVHAEHGNDAHA